MSSHDKNTKNPVVTLHLAASLDGFIAKEDNDVSWLNSPENAYESGITLDSDEVESILKSIDCYVMGSRTYEHALELGWPYGDTPVIVVTNRQFSAVRESVEFYAGDLKELIHQHLAPRYGNIWLVGGAILCQEFLRFGLVDKIILSIAPVLLGGGLRLFDDAGTEQRWRLTDAVAYKTGFVELSYEIESSSHLPSSP